MTRHFIISTTDPENQGGVWGVTKALADAVSGIGFDVTLIYPSARCMSRTEKVFGGHKAIGFPYKKLGNTYLSEWTAAGLMLRDVPDDAVCVAVGGGNQTAMPFLIGKRQYSLWISNTVDDEYTKTYSPFRVGISFGARLKALWLGLTRPLTRYLENKIFQRAKTIYVESKYSLQEINSAYHIEREKLIHLAFPMALRRDWPIDPRGRHGTPYVLFVGRLDDPRKNVIMLINAFRKLKCKRFKLVLVGRYSKEGPVWQSINEMGAECNIEAKGFVDLPTLNSLYEGASCFVMPSLQEGLGNAVVEAMSFGLPVVATRCGGVEDSVRQGENGFLVNIGDEDEMAEKISLILEDSALAQKLSAGAIHHVRQIHNPELFTRTVSHGIGNA